jgi:hypothetical protein
MNAFSPTTYVPSGIHGIQARDHQRYRDDHCRTMNDLLRTSDDFSGLVSSTGGNTAREHRCRNKHQLAKKIGYDFLGLVLDHLISTGDEYKLPVGDNSRLRIVSMSAAQSQMLYARGRYRMNDVHATGGRFYHFRLELGWRGVVRKKGVYVDMGRYYRLCRLIATGAVVYDLS